MALVKRDRGDYAGADTALAQALDVCERAGLIAQSIQAISARAVTLAAAGNFEAAREAADEAGKLCEQLSYPVASAAALEAKGATTPGPAGLDHLRAAHERWTRLGRVLDAARCQLLIGTALQEHDSDAAASTLATASRSFEELGIHHLAAQARELART